MCLIALFFHVARDAPLVVGANREEFYSRGGEPPRLFADGPARFVAGRDPTSGGTWLGVNRHGVLAAVTNRRTSRRPDRPRSRGLLVRDLLACQTASKAAAAAVRELDGDRYDGCNVVCADAQGATVIQAGDWLRVRPLPIGLHVLTNGDVNDDGDARLTLAAELLEAARPRSAADCVAALRGVCGRRQPDEPPICLHGADRGTVSSSIIVVRNPIRKGVYLHAQGPPDRTAFADYSELLRRLTD
jgi:uncharacterized protein with NRDE domain